MSESFSLTEADYEMRKQTRMFDKKRKNWSGRKKPRSNDQIAEDEVKKSRITLRARKSKKTMDDYIGEREPGFESQGPIIDINTCRLCNESYDEWSTHKAICQSLESETLYPMYVMPPDEVVKKSEVKRLKDLHNQINPITKRTREIPENILWCLCGSELKGSRMMIGMCERCEGRGKQVYLKWRKTDLNK